MQKTEYKKPVQLAQAAMQASTDPASVLALLDVQNFTMADADEGVKLCAAAAQRGDIKLLEWLCNHGCPCNSATCSTTALIGRLEVLMWAHESGFLGMKAPAGVLRKVVICMYCSGRVSTSVPGAKTRAAKQQLQVICTC
jgi:hypothetical protein